MTRSGDQRARNHPLSGHRLTRRALLRTAALASGGAVMMGALPPLRLTAAAQQQRSEPAFSDTVLRSYGLPEIELIQTEQGYQAPSSVAAGRYLISLNSARGMAAYLDVVQMPTGLVSEEAGRQLLSAARDDTPVDGWTYAGGTYAVDGDTAWIALDLTPGDWTWGLTSQPTKDGAEEIPHLMPLNVGAATPVATPVAGGVRAIQPAVDVAMADMVFQGLGGATIPAGPAVWRFHNVGRQPHHMVLTRTPRLITPDDVKQLVSSFMSATPTPPPPWWTEIVWVGYTALLSPGHEVFTEFTLTPGTYLALCFIVDPTSHMPHLAEGMAQSFTVGQGGTPVSATPVLATPTG